MAITLDGIFINGQKATFHPEDILSGDASAYTEEIGTAVEEWLEENVTGGEQVTDTTLTLPGVPADAEATGDKIEELKEDLVDLDNLTNNLIAPINLLKSAVTVIPNMNFDTTTGAKNPNSAFTIYVIPYNGETLFVNQLSDSLRKVILCSDANADTVLGFAADDGLTVWNSYYTPTISGVSYIAFAVKSNYYDTAIVVKQTEYQLLSEYSEILSDDIYIKSVDTLTRTITSLDAVVSPMNDAISPINLLENPVTVIPNTNIDTSTGTKNPNSAFTIYVIPYNGETLYINQLSDNLKKVILCSDADADNVLDFANNDGFTTWNSYYTSTISGATYIAFAVKSNYYDTALVTKKSTYALSSDYDRILSNKVYIESVKLLGDDVGFIEKHIDESKNLFDFTKISEWGYWVNYTNGNVQATQYVVTYAYSDYIEVEPNTAYATQHGSRGIAFYKADKTFISGVNTNTFTTPETCKYIRMNVSYSDPDYCYTMLLKRSTAITNNEVYIPPYYGFEKPKRNYITCGTGGDYPTIKQGFEIATALDVDCVIMPGTYDLVSEGISGKGYTLPKRTYGYGATLVCRLSEEDWNLSPLNVSVYSSGAEVYGLTVICANCRYCIHDDMGAMVKQSYHNVFKDLHLIHESAVSATLLAPQCIGGGFGLEGMVEIENCIFEATIRDVSYHSASGGTQRKGCTLRCSNSVFSHTYTSTNVGTSTAFMNVSYICGCKMASLPNTTPTANTKIIEWNNVTA